MAFWNRRSVDTGTEEEEIYRSDGRHWPALLIYLLIALIVATGVVFAGRWAYRKATTPENPIPPISKQTENSTSKPAQKSAPIKKESTSSESSNSKSASGSSPAPKKSSSSTAATNQQSNQPLPNSGPADVTAIFISSAIAASSLFYIVSLRRSVN